MITPEQVISLGFQKDNKVENQFNIDLQYFGGILLIENGQPIPKIAKLSIILDPEESEHGTYIIFKINDVLGPTGYYTDLKDLANQLRLNVSN